MRYDPLKAFPYPILSDNKDYSDDYPYRDFQATVRLEETESGCARLTANFVVSEEKILEHIEHQDAVYAVHVLCTQTNYRRLIPSSKPNLIHQFDGGEIYDKVTLMACVVCKKSIQNYSSPNFHPEFENAKPNFRPGNILAIAEPETYQVGAKFNRPLGTVFTLARDKDVKKGEFTFRVDDEVIVICLHEADYLRVNAGRQNRNIQNFLMMSLYYPVLVEVLRLMGDKEGSAHESRKWYRAIKSKLEQMDIDIETGDCYIHAQRLMHSPLQQLPLMED